MKLLYIIVLQFAFSTQEIPSGSVLNSIDDDSVKYVNKPIEIPVENLNTIVTTKSTTPDYNGNTIITLLANGSERQMKEKVLSEQYPFKKKVMESKWDKPKHLREKKDNSKSDFFFDDTLKYNDIPIEISMNKETISENNMDKYRPYNTQTSINHEFLKYYKNDNGIMDTLFEYCNTVKTNFLSCLETILDKMEHVFVDYMKQRCVKNENCYERNGMMNVGGKHTSTSNYLPSYQTQRPYQIVFDDNTDYSEDAVKQIQTYNWAGKRLAYDGNSIPKRMPFHAWGGKRSNQVGTEKIQASRVPFNAWGGKRNEATNEDNPDKLYEPKYPTVAWPFLTYKKSRFHSWGGKRNYE